MKDYDVIVVGGGHSGLEAASAAARMGCSVALISMDKHAIGRMSCNPAIGGSAKGHLVHEVDALGGEMGLIADKTGIQFKTLNKSKGPAVWAGRCQSDRDLYSEEAERRIVGIKNLEIIEDSVIDAFEENGEIRGVKTGKGEEYYCKALIVNSGTFLNGKMFTGLDATAGGRHGENAAIGLTNSFLKMGFESGRLKTGTPPRLNKNTIDFSVLKEQPGDANPEPFSLRTDKSLFPFLPQISCHIAHTNLEVHKILETGFEFSPIFTGVIDGIGPRYCPSIEDKIVRFSDKPQHQLFLEPEGLEDDLIYLNGFPTSLPADVQYKAIKKITGLENVEMVRPGYAVEYDYFPPYQVELTLETKKIKGLYFAGQINGTSGYEEAAGQGLVAGINAALKIQGKPEFIMKRSESYIGVLIDDLVRKSTKEPYRMFTSRAEHRLILRQDNSDRRLMKYGYEFGLVPRETYEELKEREILISNYIETFNSTRVKPSAVSSYLEKNNSRELNNSEMISKIIKRPEVELSGLLDVLDENDVLVAKELKENPRALMQTEIEIKYEGYIQRQKEMVKKLENLEAVKIPIDFDFFSIKSLSMEGRDKLTKIKPRNLGQASRISGVTPSDISVLLVYLKNQ